MSNELTPIPGYEGFYGITIDGRVYSYVDFHKTLAGRWLKPDCTGQYKRVTLTTGKNRTKRHTVHRLVAMTFIPNPKNLPQVNHIDGDKYNNHYQNLEWCTGKHNVQHAIRLGLRKPVIGVNTKLTDHEVLAIRASSATNLELANQYNVSREHIYHIRRGTRRTVLLTA